MLARNQPSVSFTCLVLTIFGYSKANEIREQDFKLLLSSGLKLSHALGDSRALLATFVRSWATLVRSRALSVTRVVLATFATILGTLTRCRRLRATTATLAHFRQLSCAVGDSRALSATLMRTRRISCALGDSHVLLVTLVRFQQPAQISLIVVDSFGPRSLIVEENSCATLILQLAATLVFYFCPGFNP